MEITQKKSLYMRGLQAAYSGVLEVVEHVFHTAVYRYFPDQKRWERMDMEGSAYITRNSSSPLYSFIVLNKKGPADLILHIEENIEKINIQDTYLMMRCTNDMGKVILGFFLRDDNDRVRMFQALNRLKDSRRGSPVDMSSMLSKLISAANKAAVPVSEPSPTLTSNKAAQLLSILKQPESTNAEEFPTFSASVAATKSSALLSLLRAGSSSGNTSADHSEEESSCDTKQSSKPIKSQSQSNVGNVEDDRKKTVNSNNNQEAANKLLSLIKTPPRPAIAANVNNDTAVNKTGDELLTDGDIAVKCRILRAVSEPTTAVSSSSPPSTISSSSGVAALKAALSIGSNGVQRNNNHNSNAQVVPQQQVKQGIIRAPDQQSAAAAFVSTTTTSPFSSAVINKAVVVEKKVVELAHNINKPQAAKSASTTPVLSFVPAEVPSPPQQQLQQQPWPVMKTLPPPAMMAVSTSSGVKVPRQVKLISPSDLEAF